jgi:hypothetical protein
MGLKIKIFTEQMSENFPNSTKDIREAYRLKKQ